MFMPYTNNKGADQPAHPRRLISAFVVHCLDSIIPIMLHPKFQDSSVAEKADLSLTWSNPQKAGFLVAYR